MTISLPILYQDDVLIAVDKPSGLPVHRDAFSPRGQVVCLQLLRDQVGRDVHPVHRLDSATSGVLLFSHDRAVLAAMMQQFMARTVNKTYHCIVRGWMKSETTCDLPLKRDDGMQDASTHFRPLSYLLVPWTNERFPQSRYTFLEVKPETGRYHQIRRHANYLAHPLVGDTKHGDSDHNRLWRAERNCHRLLLHASSLVFTHPLTGDIVSLNSPLCPDFARHLGELPWRSSFVEMTTSPEGASGDVFNSLRNTLI